MTLIRKKTIQRRNSLLHGIDYSKSIMHVFNSTYYEVS